MTPEDAEQAWHACRKGVEDASGEQASPRRIYRLRWVHNGDTHEASVGEKDPYDNMTVMAIVVTDTRYWVCNLKRGFFKTPAPMVGPSDVRDVEDFDPASY